MNDDKHGPNDDSAGEAAIEWWVRSRTGFSREERAAFEAWRAADPANARAFDDVVRMCGKLSALQPSRQPSRLSSSRLSWGFGTAALAAASLVLIVDFNDLTIMLHADYSVGAQAPKLVSLEDGSRVQLDARSAIEVAYSEYERRLALTKGEAWFEVAKDPARPFIVEAAGGTITARGTAFDVALQQPGARVIVTEHRVSVLSGGKTVIVEQGEETTFGNGIAAASPSRIDVETATAWRSRLLVVEKQPLGEVLARLGQYHHGYVFCANTAICSRRITGVFGTDDPLQALHEIEASLGLHTVRLTNYLVLLYE